MTQELSEYELTRAENIKRNEEFIKSLGIAPLVKKESKRSTSTSASKRRKSRQSDASNDNDDNDDYFYVKEEGADIDETNHFPIERKKSRRLQNMAPDYHTIDPNILLDLTNNADYDNNGSYDDLPLISITPRVPMTFDEEEDAERLPIDAEQVRQFIDSTNPAHKDIITNKVIYHTVHRMSYMSNKKLALRLRMISGGRGRESHIKLLVFYYALLLANLNNLAASAKEMIDQLGVIE